MADRDPNYLRASAKQLTTGAGAQSVNLQRQNAAEAEQLTLAADHMDEMEQHRRGEGGLAWKAVPSART